MGSSSKILAFLGSGLLAGLLSCTSHQSPAGPTLGTMYRPIEMSCSISRSDKRTCAPIEVWASAHASAKGEYPETTRYEYAWNFGDGSPAIQQSGRDEVRHTYRHSSTYRIVGSVTAFGGSVASTCEKDISIPCALLLAGPPNNARVGLRITFGWAIENRTPGMTCLVILDKGANPFDGSWEDTFDAGEADTVTVTLDGKRYFDSQTVDWGVKCGAWESETWRFIVG